MSESHHRRDAHVDGDSKKEWLERHTENPEGTHLTTEQGVPINDTDNSLRAGERGPTLIEDFHFREKLTHFDHERIPERVVHARGSAAHGTFQVYESMAEITKAAFLQDPSVKTPVFVRFSTVAGFRGSADTVRDVRGFATKFYTSDGNFDLVGNNMPVFFIQDAIKFPDLVHSIKPEPHHEMPQASAAHDNFWDFISLTPESMHMIMWVLSDRALPRSYAMMEGFGVHTFRFVNELGEGRFVKFHWKPVKPMASLVWDETQKIAGKDPDFNRKDLWEAIERGDFPEFELGVQIVEEKDEHSFDFDLLDATKIIPEEIVPVRIIGRMTLDRNPDNFFAETEQAAFHPGHIVPGIDFTNDPLLQGRLFSYLDTQLIRLGGPNFAEIPINRPVVPVHNNQRDGYSRQTINRGRTNYSPNTVGGGCPMTTPEALRGFVHYAEKVDGHKVRRRSESFGDHYGQATLFWNSLSAVEKEHLVEAAQFELGKVETVAIRERMIEHFNNVDNELAVRVAEGLGLTPPAQAARPNHGRTSPALSMDPPAKRSVKGRKLAVLVGAGVDAAGVETMKKHFESEGVVVKLVARSGGTIDGLKVDELFITSASVLYDAVIVAGGAGDLSSNGSALHFINEAFRHCKPIGAIGDGVDVVAASSIRDVELATDETTVSRHGVVTTRGSADGPFLEALMEAVGMHRHWDRVTKDAVPA